MINRNTMARWLLISAILLPLVPTPGNAQRVFVEGRVGIVVPSGALNELEKVGSAFAGGLGYRWDRRLAARIDFEHDFLQGEDIIPPSGAAPAVVLRHVVAAVEVSLPEVAPLRLSPSANLGAGATHLDFESFSVPSGPQQGTYDISGTYFTLNGGARLSYYLRPSFSLLASGQAYWIFVDREDTKSLSLRGEGVPSVGSTWTFPLTLGLRIAL
ncbi:MAG: hypothetical protein H0X65_10255 [Gemmatimonadetes bacterium]|nr:hypothetical protein [Gemmatimonadota bacterium]